MISLTSTSRQPVRQPWTLDKLVHERSIMLGLSIDESTLSSYSSALNSYITFCRLHNFPIDPTPDTLSFYATYMSHHIKPASVSTYLSGIANQLEVYYPDVRQARKSPLVVRTLQGCKRLKGSPVTRKLPLSIPTLTRILSSLDHSQTHDDLLFCAMICTGLYGLLRLGELSYPDNPCLRNPENYLDAPQSPFLPLAPMLSCSHVTKQIHSLKAHTFIFAALFIMHLIPSLTLLPIWLHGIISSHSIVNFGCAKMVLYPPGLSSSSAFAYTVTNLLQVNQCVQVVLLHLLKLVFLPILFKQLAIGALRPGVSMSARTLSSFRPSFFHLCDFLFHSLPSLHSPLLKKKKKKKKFPH